MRDVSWSFYITMIVVSLMTLPEQPLQAQQILWTSPYGGNDVATDSSENVIITGGSRTVKFTPDGDTLWTRTLSKIHACGVATDPWGNVIITGYTYVDTNSLEDYCTVKYSPDGDTIWSRTFDSGDWDEAHSVAIDHCGNVLVTGWICDHYSGLYNYCTIKYDSDGNTLWKRIFDWRWEDFAQDVAVDKEGNVIVTGYSDNNINWDWCTVKYSSAGDTLWIRRVDFDISDWPFGVATDPWDNIVVVGHIRIGVGLLQSFAMKYNSKGDTLWARLYDNNNEFSDVATDASGNIIMKSLRVLLKCNPGGDTLWTVDTPGYFGHVSTDLSGNVILTNGSETIKYEGSSGVTVEEEIYYSFPNDFSLAQNYPNPFNSTTVIGYSVPETDSEERLRRTTLRIYNILGEEVRTLVDSKQNAGKYQVVWDGKDNYGKAVATGVYFCRLQVGEKFCETRKIVLLT